MFTHQLGIVQRHDHTKISHPETGDEPTRQNEVLVDCAGLNDDTHAEDDHRDNNRDPAAQRIGQVAVDQGSQPSAQFKNRGQHTLSDSGEFGVTMGLDSMSRGTWKGCWKQ